MNVGFRLASTRVITEDVEEKLVLRAMAREPNILILANRYRSNPAKFLKFATTAIASAPATITTTALGVGSATTKPRPDVVFLTLA